MVARIATLPGKCTTMGEYRLKVLIFRAIKIAIQISSVFAQPHRPPITCSRHGRLTRTSRSSTPWLQLRMCLRTNKRSTTSAGAPGRPRLRLLGCRFANASYTAVTICSSARTWSACCVQSSRRSLTSSAIRPSPKLSCARRNLNHVVPLERLLYGSGRSNS